MAIAPMAGTRRAAVLVAALALLGSGVAPAYADDAPELLAPPVVDAPADSGGIRDSLSAKLPADSAIAYAEDAIAAPGLRAAEAESTAAGTGSISGTLTHWWAGVSGYALPTAAIDAYVVDDATGDLVYVTSATAGADGAYTLTGLAAGEYILLAYDTEAGSPLLPEFYPDAQSLSWADAVSVGDGEAVTYINEQLEPLQKDRLAGQDRFETAVAASKAGFGEGVPCVFIANGLAFPDALSAGPAAAHCGGPLLLVRDTTIPKVVLDELARLKPEMIMVAGGTGAVSAGVEATLRTLAPEFIRYAGTDRYDTSRKIVAGAFGSSEAVWIADGANFPDALSASGAAAAADIPVMIVPGVATSLDAASKAAIGKLGATYAAIAGGPGAVSNGIASSVSAIPTVEAVERFGGATRYETSDAITTFVWGGGWAVYAFLASGTDFPDALAAAPLAGWVGGPLFITPATCTTADTEGLIQGLGVAEAYVMGYYQPLYFGSWDPFRTC